MNVLNKQEPSSILLALLLAISGISLIAGCDGSSDPATAEAHPEEDVAGGAHSDEGAGKHIELTAAQIDKAGIGIVEAGPGVINEHLSTYGVVAPDAEHMLDVTARFPGVIRSVKKRVGERVRKSETLALIESNESLQTYPVVAPLDGVVTHRNANQGAQTGDGPLFTVADLSTVWVELSIFPRDLAKVKLGQTVRVHSGDTGLSADGKLVYVAPFGSASNQTLTARVQLANRDQKWPPGLYVTANIVLASSSVPLTIRNEAIQTLEGRTVVFVRRGEKFESSEVRLGRTDGEVSEVLSGISAGESYATQNSFVLKAELGKGEAGHED